MPWINKIEKFITKMGVKNYESYQDGFVLQLPGDTRVVRVHIFVKEPYLAIKTFFIQSPETDVENFLKDLLFLNGKTFMVKWYIDSDRDVYVATERLLRDMQFSEFEAAVKMVVKAYDNNINEYEKR